MRRPALVTWAIYLLVIPLYILPSGLPQPGDLLVLLVVPLALQHWNGKLGRDTRSTVRALMWFTLRVCALAKPTKDRLAATSANNQAASIQIVRLMAS